MPLLPMATTGNAGLPAGFRKKTPNGDARMGAGILFVTPDGKGLFTRRAPGRDHAGEWAFPAGRVEEDEEPADAARREATEEIGHLAKWELAPLHRETRDNVDFTTFGQPVPAEFDPVLNEEHNDHVWADLRDPPQPLHPGVAALLAKFFAEEAEEPEHQAFDGIAMYLTSDPIVLAMDEESMRSVDQDGHLHIAETNVCKACVSPYKGSEIPGYEQLGLDPDEVYQMLRPPEELAKSFSTINGKPLLRKHIATSADDHQADDVVGAVGTTARWDPPYIKNGLTIWPNKDIHGIETGTKYQLSPGYHYTALMEPGEFNGEEFDGQMVDIRFNHLALVEEGRQGPDVVVADSAVEAQWGVVARAFEDFLSEPA